MCFQKELTSIPDVDKSVDKVDNQENQDVYSLCDTLFKNIHVIFHMIFWNFYFVTQVTLCNKAKTSLAIMSIKINSVMIENASTIGFT